MDFQEDDDIPDEGSFCKRLGDSEMTPNKSVLSTDKGGIKLDDKHNFIKELEECLTMRRVCRVKKSYKLLKQDNQGVKSWLEVKSAKHMLTPGRSDSSELRMQRTNSTQNKSQSASKGDLKLLGEKDSRKDFQSRLRNPHMLYVDEWCQKASSGDIVGDEPLLQNEEGAHPDQFGHLEVTINDVLPAQCS